MSPLVLALFKAKKKNKGKNDTKTKKTKKSETPQGGAGASETPDFFCFFWVLGIPYTFDFANLEIFGTFFENLYAELAEHLGYLPSTGCAQRYGCHRKLSEKKPDLGRPQQIQGRSTNRKNVFTHI